MTTITLLFIVCAVALTVSVVFNLYQKIKINKTLRILELKNQNLMLAIRSGNIAVWGYDVHREYLYNIEGEVFLNGSSTVANAMADIHPEDRDEFQRIFVGVINGVLPTDTVCVRLKNSYTGEWDYIEKEFAIIRSRNGEVETVIGTHKDVTRRVRSTEQIEELLKKYQQLYDENLAVMDALPAGVSIYNNQGELIYINQTLCDMFAIVYPEKLLSVKEALPMLFEYIDEDAKDYVLKGENHMFQYYIDCNYAIEEYCLRRDKTVYVTCIFSVVRDAEGEISRYVFIHRDITTEHLREKELREMSDMNKLILKNMRSSLVYVSLDREVIWENMTDKFSDTFTGGDKLFEVGGKCSDTIMASLRANEGCRMSEVAAAQSSRSIEKTLSNGNTIEIVGNPVIDNDGNLIGTILRVDDITERKRLYKELEQSRNKALSSNELMREILSRLPAAMFIKDPGDDYRYVLASKMFCDIFNKAEEDIIGKTDFDFIEQGLAARYRAADQAVVSRNEPLVIDEESSYNGELRCWNSTKSWFTSINNRKLLISVLIDVTQSRLNTEELQKAKDRAEESDRLKSAFLANMSHEIRTPLNAIVGFSELMQSCDDPAEKQEYMRIIAANNELLLRLINDILDLSKLESGIIRLECIEFDLALYFDDLAAEMKQRINNPNIEFITVNPCRSCILTTDKTRMAQVWLNFMSNAIKYTRSGYIKMGYQPERGGIKIYVEDSGIGIPDAKRDKLFQRFEKLDSFAQGTGLGLSICKAITELAGGEVGFSANEGGGSTFWSWIPIDVRLEYKDDSESPLAITERHEEVDAVLEDVDETVCRILIAEDNDSNYMLISHMLKNTATIQRAVNGEQAVAIMRESPIDIVLMDIKMPVMDGLQATRAIREFNSFVPIIAVTANAFDSNRDDAFSAGCSDFLAKPVRKEALMEVMHKALKHRKA